MKDSDSNTDTDIGRLTSVEMTTEQLKAFGDLIIKWTLDPSTRPADLCCLKSQLRLIGYPDDFDDFEIIEREKGKFKVLLPEPEMVAPAVKEYCEAGTAGYYTLPKFYGDLAFQGASARVADNDKCEFYKLRVGDYTTARCG